MGWFTLVAAGMQAASSISAGVAAAEAGYTQKALDEVDARANLAAAQYNALQVRRARRATQGSARAAYAASGVKVDTGTAGAVVNDIAARGEQDVYQTLLEGGQVAERLRQRGAQAADIGKQQQTASLINAGSALASGYAQYKKGWK